MSSLQTNRTRTCTLLTHTSKLLCPLSYSLYFIERKVRVGFEPTHERFAVTCLTTWLPNLIVFSFGSHECEEFLLSQSVAVANLCVPVTLFTHAHENLFL